MLVYRDYDTYYSKTRVGTEVYPCLLVEKSIEAIDLSSAGLEPIFIQGSSALKVQKVRQNPVYHSQIRGEINPFMVRDGQAGRFKGIGDSDFLVSGEAVTGNCEQLVQIGDKLQITQCYMHNDSPAMSLFHLYSLEVVPYGSYKRLKISFMSLICYEVKGLIKPVYRLGPQWAPYATFKSSETYDVNYLKSIVPESQKISATETVLSYYLNGRDGTAMYPALLSRIDVESDFQLILSTLRNKFFAFNAMLMSGPVHIDPLYDYRMGYCADAAVQGNLFVVESNMLEMWKEVLAGGFGNEIKEWSQAISNLSKNRKGHTRRVAKAYLSTTYGSQLTLNDMEQWKSAIEKYMWRSYNARSIAKARARDSFVVGAPDYSLMDGTIDYNYSLIYDPLERFGGNLDIRNTLRSFRLTPNHKRVWEIIPFSFVVDWFLPISDYFAVMESEDTILENNYRIKGEVNSVKMRFSFREYPTVELVAYTRNCSCHPITKPFPNLEELNPSKRGVSGSAYINGTALVLSKGKAKPR